MNVYCCCHTYKHPLANRHSAKKRNEEFGIQMLVMNGLSFKSENKCSFVLFCRFDVQSLGAFVVRTCVHRKRCVSAVTNKTMAEILINYSCLFGPYTSFCEYTVRLLLHLQMKLFAIPVESFPTMFIFRFCKIYIALSRGIHTSAPLNNDNASSMREQISYFRFCAQSNFVVSECLVLNFKHNRTMRWEKKSQQNSNDTKK